MPPCISTPSNRPVSSPASMPTQTLKSLPIELLRHILQYADVTTLAALSETCHFFRHILQDESLWRTQAQSRFRVSPRAKQSRRLQVAGGISWRALYAQWHLQMRMPASRVSGGAHVAFAKGGAQGILVWVMVASSEDCRLVRSKLKLRVLIQNVWGGPALNVTVGKGMEFLLTDGLHLRVHQATACIHSGSALGPGGRSVTPANKYLPFRDGADLATVMDYKAYVKEWFIERPQGRDWAQQDFVLAKDDFAVLNVEVQVPGARFEVDALERLQSLTLKASRGADVGCELVARFYDKVLWDSYERLPGGWWVRKDSSAAHRG